MSRLRRILTAVGDVWVPVVSVVGVASLVTSVVLGFQIESLGNSIQQTTQQQVVPHAKAAASNSAAAKSRAGKAAKDAADAERVVNNLPEIEQDLKLALNNGQAQINRAILWADCELYYGPRACGPPPPLPGVTPVTTTTTAPAAPLRSGAISAPTAPSAPAAPAPAPTAPTHGHRGHH